MFSLSRLYNTCLFIGFIKWAPGTVASFISIILITFVKNNINFFLFNLIFIFLLLISIKMIDIYSAIIGKKDASEIVIDEVIGVYFIFIIINNLVIFSQIIDMLLIFILFRFFDIFKPFPIKVVDQKIKNSIGVILDDIIAGVYTIIILLCINAFI